MSCSVVNNTFTSCLVFLIISKLQRARWTSGRYQTFFMDSNTWFSGIDGISNKLSKYYNPLSLYESWSSI